MKGFLDWLMHWDRGMHFAFLGRWIHAVLGGSFFHWQLIVSIRTGPVFCEMKKDVIYLPFKKHMHTNPDL
jgi:hypothetical protein